MLRSLKLEHGFTTFLNLWHFTLPRWAVQRGGWEDPDLLDRWGRLVERCAKRLGPYVDHWSTMIDAQLYPLAGYLLGEIPPCKRDRRLCLRVFETLLVAHAIAYRILHEHDVRDADGRAKTASVGQIFSVFGNAEELDSEF